MLPEETLIVTPFFRSWWHPKTGSRTNFGTLSGCQG